MKTSEVLILGKDGFLGQNFRDHLASNGHRVSETLDQRAAVQKLDTTPPAIVIVTSAANDMQDGLNLVKQLRQNNRHIPIIMISRYSSEDKAISAFREGVNDYFKVPFCHEDVMHSVTRCLNGHASLSSSRLEKKDSVNLLEQKIIGTSKPMAEIRAYLSKVAATDTTVLITGETGTGKELVAESIHHGSPKNGKPFVPINCAALPESLVESELFGYDRGAFTGAIVAKQGKFELASGGSVFWMRSET